MIKLFLILDLVKTILDLAKKIIGKKINIFTRITPCPLPSQAPVRNQELFWLTYCCQIYLKASLLIHLYSNVWLCLLGKAGDGFQISELMVLYSSAIKF